MSSFKALLPAALLLAGTAAPALAQVVGDVSSVNGNVVVTRGGAAYAAQTSGSLMSGDCVTALSNASTVLTLANGCSMTVAPGQSVVVNANTSNCSSAFSTQATSCYVVPAGGVVAGGAALGAGAGAAGAAGGAAAGGAAAGGIGAGAAGAAAAGGVAAAAASLPLLPIAISAAVVGGAVVAADDEPASP